MIHGAARWPAPGIRKRVVGEMLPISSVLVVLFTLVAIRCPMAAAAEPLTGEVVGVTDGDTITVLVDHQPITVRLAEIDTPERGQPWASRAKQALSDKVFGQVIQLQVVDTDRYGRTVAKVFRDGRDINREMVGEGHAWGEGRRETAGAAAPSGPPSRCAARQTTRAHCTARGYHAADAAHPTRSPT